MLVVVLTSSIRYSLVLRESVGGGRKRPTHSLLAEMTRRHTKKTRARLSEAARKQHERAVDDGSELERCRKISATMKRLRNSPKGKELWSESGNKISSRKLNLSPAEKKRIYQDPERSRKISQKRKRFLAANPKFKSAMVQRFMDAPKHRKTGPNTPEMNVVSLGIDKLELTSSGGYFVSFKDGRHKNPDFIVREFPTQRRTRAVVEIMDYEYWHSRTEATAIRNRYLRQGIRCKVIDAKRCYDQRSLEAVKREIEKFIDELE